MCTVRLSRGLDQFAKLSIHFFFYYTNVSDLHAPAKRDFDVVSSNIEPLERH